MAYFEHCKRLEREEGESAVASQAGKAWLPR